MRILKIIPDTVVDGPGLRTSIYFAGCKVHCEGCHNPESWDLKGGVSYSNETILTIIKKYGNKRITLTGGNPLDQENLQQLTELCSSLKEQGYDIWLYSGYTWEQILNKVLNSQLLHSIDVVVDGPFILSLKNSTCLYRGSTNQRIINVPKSLELNKIIINEDIL